MAIEKIRASRVNTISSDQYAGNVGLIWYDPNLGDLRIYANGEPGGMLITGGGGNGSPGGANGQVQFNQNGNFGGSANLTFDRTTGALTAVSFVGDGSALSNIIGSNVTGTVADATHATVADSANAVAGANVSGTVANAAYATTAGTAGTVTTAAQPNITSVGTLTSITSTGNISTTGNVTGGYILGNGSQLTGIVASSSYSNSNVAAYLPTYTGNLAALTGNVTTTANVSGNYILGNGSQLTGIVSNYGNANVVANLAALGSNPISTTGNVTAGYFIGNGYTLTSVNASNITGQVANALVAGTVYTAAQPNITSVGTLTSITSTGNVTGGNLLTGGLISAAGNITGNYFSGNGSQLTGITAANISGTVANATYATTAESAITAGTVTTAAQPNITSVGTLTSVTSTGNVTGGNLLTSGLISATGNITSAANITGGNLTTAGLITATGNITGGNILGSTASLSGNITGGNLITAGQVIAGNGAINQPGFRFAGDADTGFYLSGEGNILVTTNTGIRAAFNDSGISVPGLISVTGNVTGGNINTAGRVVATGNINGGNLMTTGAVYSNYNTNTANTGSFMATGGNTKGGTGYLDFLVIQNTSGGATVPYKWLRTTSDGQFQIINSAYTQNLFNLTDAGVLSIPGQLFINGSQATNGPAFSAYAAAILQTIPNNTQTKVLFQTEEYDTNSNYANSRFTPTVAGYYQLNAEVRLDGSSGTGEMMIILYKNGAEYKRGTNQSGTQIASNFWAMQVSSVAYANGTGDYFEIYVQQGSGSDRTVTAVNNSAITWFNGCMLRGA